MIVVINPLEANQQRLLVHISHTGQAVTADGLEALISAIHKENMVLCISSGGFTEKAIEYASSLAPNKVVLMDLEKFVDQWIGNYDRLTPEARQRFPFEAIRFLSLPE
jgi:predicted Mrr-cat superfamily restriction endonuclease